MKATDSDRINRIRRPWSCLTIYTEDCCHLALVEPANYSLKAFFRVKLIKIFIYHLTYP